ncbi:nicotinamidase [Folsomia candida]|uniref:nicotinamidase n=1 Tax=Folsomia candida TaxID=158441 RepID=A0A226E7Q4_FOLCA|nr:nicotinamidase [Folsomia candida]XP_035709243.1 nicotinamidase [Folsomia candida]OXA52901.1 Pyrazinamidase/nicotinamidase [Folsomia candida]
MATANGSQSTTTSSGTSSPTGDNNPSFVFTPTTPMENCFLAFDTDGDGCLNYQEFAVLCRALFRNERDKPYHIEPKSLKEMFDTFDINHDGLIDEKEFESCWQKWIRKIVRPITALVVVDVQNDFISGSLSISNCPAKQNGEEVVEPINRLLDSVEFDSVYYTLDWHPENHISFLDNINQRKLHFSSKIPNPDDAKLYDTVTFEGPPVMEQRLWPRHCVQNSWGAKMHENLKIIEGSPFIYKGTNPDVDSYSAFWDNFKLSQTALITELESKGVTDCYVCGLAYDVCVGATAFHAVELGYRTVLIDDACRGITLEDIQATKQKLNEHHGVVIHSDQVKDMVQGRDRHPELGLKLAFEIRKQLKRQNTINDE